MADLTYSVEVAYFSSGRVDSGLDRAKQSTNDWLKGLTRSAESLTGTFNGAFDAAASSLVSSMATAGAAAGAAVAAGLGKALHEGIAFASVVESAQLGIATVKSTLGDMPFPKAFRQATEVTEELRKGAARLPGEFKDALEMYSSIAPSGIRLGIDDKALAKLSTRGVAMAAALGIKQTVAAHELGALLEGNAKSSMPLARKLGIHAKDWSKLKPQERYDHLDGLFTKADPAVKAYASSWEGLTSSAKDNARNVARSFAGPVFGSLKGELERGLDWFGNNEDAVHAWATNLGVYVDRAFHYGLDAIHRWRGPVTTFATTLYNGMSRAFGVAGPYLDKLARATEGFMQDPRALEKMAHAASALVALRAGTGALSLGLSGVSAVGPTLASAGVGAAELAAVAGPAAIGVAALAVAAQGAIHSLTDSSSYFHEAATQQAAGIVEHAAGASKQWSELGSKLQPVADAIGTYYLGMINSNVMALEGFGAALNKWADVQLTAASSLSQLVRGKLGIMNDDPPMQIERTQEYFGFVKSLNAPPEPGEDHNTIKPPKHVTNITNKIEVKIETNMDPNRVVAIEIDKQLRALQQRAGNPAAAFTPRAPAF